MVTEESPQTFVTDKWLVEIFHRSRIVRFRRRRILAGEIVADKGASFTLRVRDFQFHPAGWRLLAEALMAWSRAAVPEWKEGPDAEEEIRAQARARKHVAQRRIVDGPLPPGGRGLRP